MRQIRQDKRRGGRAGRKRELPPADPRDPAIVHAHRLIRRRLARGRQ